MTLTEELVNWTWEKKCRKAADSLEKNGFTAVCCATPEAAAEYVLAASDDARSVGFGGSMTIKDLGLEPRMRERGKEILNHSAPGLAFEEKQEIMRRQLTCDLFLTGTNALTLSGVLVNIDAIGNRVGAMFFGPRKVIVVAGRNKLVDGDVTAAIRRVKDWASPPNVRRLNYKAPCGETGFCSDCSSPERICRIVSVLERKPKFTDLHVLLVNREMGL